MEVPLKSLFLFILLIMILSLLIYRVNYMEKEIVKENNKEKKNIFHLFIMKNAIIAGSIAYIIGLKTRDVMTLLLDTIINPLFSVDFDGDGIPAVSYTHLRAHETLMNLVCRLLLEKKCVAAA